MVTMSVRSYRSGPYWVVMSSGGSSSYWSVVYTIAKIGNASNSTLCTKQGCLHGLEIAWLIIPNFQTLDVYMILLLKYRWCPALISIHVEYSSFFIFFFSSFIPCSLFLTNHLCPTYGCRCIYMCPRHRYMCAYMCIQKHAYVIITMTFESL